MMELINHLSIWVDSGLSFDKWIENYKDSYLEKEKEQMVLFYVKMSQKDGSNTGIDLLEDEAIAYYNQTYLEESK